MEKAMVYNRQRQDSNHFAVVDCPCSEIARMRQEIDDQIFNDNRRQLQYELNSFFLDCPITEWRTYTNAPLAKLSGMACPYNRPSQTLPENRRCEIINRGAFAESINKDNVRADIHHDATRTFATTADGSLRIHEKADGLYATMLIPDSNLGRDIVADVQTGRLRAMSIAYNRTTMESYMSNGQRILCKARLTGVAICRCPAYPQTLNNIILETP
jgi:uncharacterized protein